MPKIVDRQQKSEAISRAALQVFREVGYHRTRMADIAGAAGVGKGTLYEYFRNKGDILRFALDSYFEAFRAGAAEAVMEAPGAAEGLLALVDFSLAHACGWEDHCAVYVDYLGEGRTAGEHAVISLDAIYGEMRDMLRGLVEQGQVEGELRRELDPEAVALLLLSIYDGVVLHRIVAGGTLDIASIRRAAQDLLAGGLLSRRPGGR